MKQSSNWEKCEHIAAGDAEEEVDRPVQRRHHHLLRAASPQGVPQAGQQEYEGEADEDEGGSGLPGETPQIFKDHRVKGVEQEQSDQTGVSPGSDENRGRLVLDGLQAGQHQAGVHRGRHHGQEDQGDGPGVDEGGDVGRGDEEDAVDPADDDEEKAMHGKHRWDVTDANRLLDEGVEEHEITDGSDCPVDNVEDGEEEDEVGEAHGPLGFAQHGHLLAPPAANVVAWAVSCGVEQGLCRVGRHL